MRRVLGVVFVSIAAVVVNGSSATAAPRATGTGNWDCRVATPGPGTGPVRTADGNEIVSWSANGCVYAGDLTGSFLSYGTDVVKRDGSFTSLGGIVCMGCTLAGRTGVFTGVQTFRGTSEDFKGKITVQNAVWGLAGLRARIRFQSLGEGYGTYTIRYSFKP